MENKFTLKHVGINLANEEEARKTAELLAMMFNVNVREGQKSIFADPYFECMKSPYLGTNGHIAMVTEDLESALEELQSKGIKLNMDTAQFDGEGKIKNVYLEGEFGGFAIHVMRE